MLAATLIVNVSLLVPLPLTTKGFTMVELSLAVNPDAAVLDPEVIVTVLPFEDIEPVVPGFKAKLFNA